MGIENRDYFRETSRYSDGGWSIDPLPSVVKKLIIANIVVYLLQIFVSRPPRLEDYPELFHALQEAQTAVEDEGGAGPTEAQVQQSLATLRRVSVVEEWFALDTAKVMRGQVWRVITCAFCHNRTGIFHILFNMLALYWFGVTLERTYGSREFLLFYLTAAAISSLAFIGLDLATGSLGRAIGASGAVMAVLMLFAIHYPRHTIYIFMIIPLEARWAVVLFVIYDLHPVLRELAGQQTFTGVAHSAHLGGLAFGFLYWWAGISLERFTVGFRIPKFPQMAAARRGMRVYNPVEESGNDELEDRLDSILQKIHDEGEDSLTPDERLILQAASQKFKKRSTRR